MSGICKYRAHSTSVYSQTALVTFSVLCGVTVPAAEVFGQVVAADDSTATTVTHIGDRYDISGGQLSSDGANLFQSFEQFDLEAEQAASFVTTPAIHNVIGRVNGGSSSVIDGTLQVSGSHANLYLMNPAGILIGPNAQLNLSGSLTASTATGIEFGNGQFAAIGDGNYSMLTGEPQAHLFDSTQAGAVVNLGDLMVQDGRALALVGGTVVNAGSLSAPGGSVILSATEGGNLIRIGREEQLLSLEVEPIGSPAGGLTMTPASIGEMLTGGGLTNATALIEQPDGTVRLSGSSTAISEAGGSAIAAGMLSTDGAPDGDISVLGDRVDLIDMSVSSATASALTVTAYDDLFIEDLADDELALGGHAIARFTADADEDGRGGFFMDEGDRIHTSGGSIFIAGAGITAGSIRTSASGSNGGDITLISSQSVSATDITARSFSDKNNAGNGATSS